MIPEEISELFFRPGTKGHKILNFYYLKYRDLFEKTICQEPDEFINQIFLNVSSIKFSEEIKNIEAYIIGTIKIQCRVQLDRALKTKKRQKHREDNKSEKTEVGGPEYLNNIADKEQDPQGRMESDEVFRIMSTFKLSLKDWEREILNSLIDEIPRIEIAEMKKQNLNTIDTQIRRLRIKLASFLKENGYTFDISDKYDFN